MVVIVIQYFLAKSSAAVDTNGSGAMSEQQKQTTLMPSTRQIIAEIHRLAEEAEFAFEEMGLDAMPPATLLEQLGLEQDVSAFLESGRMSEPFVSLVEQREFISPEEIGVHVDTLEVSDIIYRLLVHIDQGYAITGNEAGCLLDTQKWYVTRALLEVLSGERYPGQCIIVLSGFRVYEIRHTTE